MDRLRPAAERLHDALQTIDARSLDQHGDARRQLRLQPADQRLDVGEPFAARAEGLDRARALRSAARTAA